MREMLKSDDAARIGFVDTEDRYQGINRQPVTSCYCGKERSGSVAQKEQHQRLCAKRQMLGPDLKSPQNLDGTRLRDLTPRLCIDEFIPSDDLCSGVSYCVRPPVGLRTVQCIRALATFPNGAGM